MAYLKVAVSQGCCACEAVREEGRKSLEDGESPGTSRRTGDLVLKASASHCGKLVSILEE